MPLHTGHMSLISYASSRCDKLTILLVARKGDPIKAELRYSWLIEHYSEKNHVEIDFMWRDIIDDIPDEERTKAWCEYIQKRYPDLDVFFSSEKYGDVLSSYLGITHDKFDPKRKQIPISATEIRDNYREHIHYLPQNVQDFFQKN